MTATDRNAPIAAGTATTRRTVLKIGGSAFALNAVAVGANRIAAPTFAQDAPPAGGTPGAGGPGGAPPDGGQGGPGGQTQELGEFVGAPALGAVGTPLTARLRSMLPPRYRDGRPVSSAAMASAPLVYDRDGRVAWGAIWDDFCDLALAGGPPHRDTVLQPGSSDDVLRRPAGYRTVVDELVRGLRLVTGWDVDRDGPVGWVGLACPDDAAADWMLIAITAENVATYRDGATLYLPAGPDFRVEAEIKNVITAVAKTHHYWTEHAADAGLLA